MSPYQGDSNEYTQYTIFNIKKKITLNYPKSAAMGFFNNEFETAVVNEPSMFEPLRFYCTSQVKLVCVLTQGPCVFPNGVRVVGWCDGAVLTSSAGASYNLDYSRARAYCACSRCGWGLFGQFYSHLSFSLLFLPLFERRPDID